MNTKNLKKPFLILEANTHHYPRNKTISELNLIVDRIKFSPELQKFFGKCSASNEKAIETISFLFKSEVSEEIYGFLIDLEKEGLFCVLISEDGKDFIDYCQNILFQTKEIMFTSAIDLSKETKEHVTASIETVYGPEEVRVIFDSNPYLVAGFVIQDSTDIFDYSYKTNLTYHLRMYFKNKLGAQA